MPHTELIIEEFRAAAVSSVKSEITGRNALAKDMFATLLKQTKPEYQLLILCTKKGLILNSYSPQLHEQLAGYTIDMNFFKFHQDKFSSNSSAEEFTIVSDVSADSMALASQLQSSLITLLATVDANGDQQQYLLDCFNVLENAICIYNRDASLLYGNDSYFQNMQIFDKDAVIGMNVLDITKLTGIKIQSTKNGSNNLKMLDVLRNGNKILDWEVMVESQTVSNKARFVSNNMYPIKNKSGDVEGIIEISSSHQVSLNKTKKLMGLTAEYTFDSIIGASPAITQVIQQAKEYAASPYNLLIIGESGVGKELFAQSIHNYSERSREPFVALNCASFPENLIESELFGYVGGAFTGASKNGQIGKFELADGGTLFLDEVGELPFHFQSKLLRVLESHNITRIGSPNQTPVNVRVVTATNRDLEEMVDEGLFRKDLYYRLQVLSIEVPPLRKRREDLLLLSDAFFKQASEMDGETQKRFNKKAQKRMMEYEWPGNVRELRNVIHRITLLSKFSTVTEEVLEAAIHSKRYILKSGLSEVPEDKLDKCKMEVKNSYVQLIKAALEITKGNKKQAAELIGVSRRTFYRMLEKYPL